MPSYPGHAGIRAVHNLLRTYQGERGVEVLHVPQAPDYYGSALLLQARIAPLMPIEEPALVPEIPVEPDSRSKRMREAAQAAMEWAWPDRPRNVRGTSPFAMGASRILGPQPGAGRARRPARPDAAPMSMSSRRSMLGAGLALPSLATARPAAAQSAGPQSLTVLLTTEGIPTSGRLVREFVQTHPGLVSKLVLRQEDTGWLAAGLTAEVRAGRPGVDLVLTNAAGFALGAAQDIWQPLPADLLAAAERQLTPRGPAADADDPGRGARAGRGAGGPLLLHRPSVLPNPPRDAAGLMDFARQNPERFQYTRPRESLLGQVFVTGLPYLLRDRDPADPQTGWRRTWEYLQEMGRFVSYYPSSGAAAMVEFAEGGCDLAPGLLGLFLLARNSGRLPPDTTCLAMTDTPLIPQGIMLAVPQGVPAARLPAIEAAARFLLTPRVQMVGLGRGLVPGAPEGDPVPPGAVSAAERGGLDRRHDAPSSPRIWPTMPWRRRSRPTSSPTCCGNGTS